MGDDSLELRILRLGPETAEAIGDCFHRVYGESYGNGIFYDADVLAKALESGRIGSVGAVDDAGRVFGHMAMTVQDDASVIELGNTVVDPAARGAGLAWRVGAELSAWCRELGYQGFLHYPTTDHHIMQRQSVKAGFETGLMLGYIPAETHGQVGAAAKLRQAATVVYEPYGPGAASSGFVPQRYAQLLESLRQPTALARSWQPATEPLPAQGTYRLQRFHKRGVERLSAHRAGADLAGELAELAAPCRQLDLSLGEVSVDAAAELAREMGYGFCAWLPGFAENDVLRLQWLDDELTELTPTLENPMAREILKFQLADR
ncbi:MAG: GNAT family N-acetyltransferase [Pseudomonadota bacterium]